ncbi:hypothetical protein ACFQE0_04255 [Methylobacterium komagatae]|uniref:Uncharacterized protein n=1 Tax=Methylobacterium komagatae TaxID=374425 RepID=A0ABW2BFK4_9HYPH
MPNLYKKYCAILASIAFPLLASCGGSQAEGAKLQLCRYNKVFADDFNSLSVSPSNNDRTRWSAHTPWYGDFGDAKFIDPVDMYADPEKNDPFLIRDGVLVIRAASMRVASGLPDCCPRPTRRRRASPSSMGTSKPA